MANVIINDTNLTNIANAIRGKNGTTATYKPSEMAAAITAISGGGGGSDVPAEALVFSGDCSYRFYKNGWEWFWNTYKDSITTSDIAGAVSMFHYFDGAASSVVLNFQANASYGVNTDNMFYYCSNKVVSKIVNLKPSSMRYMFQEYGATTLPEFENLNMSNIQESGSANCSGMFQYCRRLRSISEDFLKQLYTSANSYYSSHFYNEFSNCWALDEIKGLRMSTGSNITGNCFSNTFSRCYRVKDVIFATQEDGTPYTANMKSQNIKLNQYVGYFSIYSDGYGGAGLPESAAIRDAETYATNKNNPDSWTALPEYSRYNHTSAVNTINSLPDTSAYLAANGGTNTITFLPTAGSLTDGGAVETLTEEEIAVAAAKGWTVAYSS